MATQKELIPDPSNLDSNTSFAVASKAFEEYMQREGFSIYTIKAFRSDLRLLGNYLGRNTAVGAIGTNDLNNFLSWLLNERDKPCSPKTYARRVTTIKVFFGWLEDKETVVINPSNKVVQRTVVAPLPDLPIRNEISNALEMAKRLATEGNGKGKMDIRPYMLMKLLLETGIKKGEAMAIELDHIEQEAVPPYIYIKYKNPRMIYKERKINISPELVDTIDLYNRQYKPESTLFTCTPRNLEYVLSDVADEQGLPKGALSFENLRWICALYDFQDNVDHETIRQKLGLSAVTWRETRNKLRKLVSQDKHQGYNFP